jgi:WD40 repeat protein
MKGKMAKPKPANYLDSPLFCFDVYKNIAIVSMGGGGKEYGLPNQVKVFKRDFPLKEELYSHDFGKELMTHFMFANVTENYLIAAVSKFVVLFSIDPSTGILKELSRYEADYASDLPGVSKVKWSNDDKLVVSGGEDGTMRIFKVNSDNKSIQGLQLEIELGSHMRDINDVSISPNNELAVSSSSDKTCRIYNIKNGK